MDQFKNLINLNGNVTYLSQDLHIIVSLSVMFIIISVYTICSNSAILIAMVNAWTLIKNRDPLRTVKKYSINKMLLMSLAVCDLCIGLLIMPLYALQIIHNGQWPYGRPLCFIFTAMDISLCGVSILHVMCLALDRYLAIRVPLSHRLLTCKLGFIMIASCWVFPVLFSASLIIYLITHYKDDEIITLQDEYQLCFIPGFDSNFTASLLTLFLIVYIAIFLLVILTILELRGFYQDKFKLTSKSRDCHVTKSVNNLSICKPWMVTKLKSVINRDRHGGSDLNSTASPAKTTPAVTSISGTPAFKTTPSTARSVERRMNNKAIFTMCSIVACFTACYMPYHLFLMFPDSLHSHKMEFPGMAVVWMTYLNSAINPAIYCLNRSARRALIELLCDGQGRAK